MQYPGVAQAVRADMQNLGIILRLMKRIAPGLDVKSTAEEIRTRIGDELDYELEAQNQRTLARIFRGHPFIRVPEVISSLSREKVLVTEYVTGLGFDAIKELDQDTRDRVGEIIFRFFFGCMYRHRQFSGDPHPGNFLLQPDGSVAFLDFGLFKVMPAELIEIELACQRAGHEGDGERLHEIFSKTGFLREPDRFRPDKLLAQFLDATWWYVLDEEVHLQPEIATEVMIEMSDPRSSHFGQMRHETLPADHLFGRRVELLTLAVLSQLRRRELAPDRARVDVRRPARDRVRPRGNRVLRLLKEGADLRVELLRRLDVETWPAGRNASRGPGMPACIASATSRGARTSSSPYSSSVGTSISGSTSRRSASATARAIARSPAG